MFFLPNHVQIPAKSSSPRDFSLLCGVMAFLLLTTPPLCVLAPPKAEGSPVCGGATLEPSTSLFQTTSQASDPWTLQENLPENGEIDKRQTLLGKEK